jgi:ribosome recycling factor
MAEIQTYQACRKIIGPSQKVKCLPKKEVEDGYPEDSGKKKEEEVDKMIQKYYSKVDDMLKAKEEDIMTV